jgi:predicted metalloprotease with PDZ domain
MPRHLGMFSFLAVPIFSIAQLNYTLSYKDSSAATLKVSIQTTVPLTAPLSFVMPRSIPGHYSSSGTYDKFIINLYAINSQGEKTAMRKDVNDAPRWYCNDTGKLISQVEYEVNLKKMERTLTPGDASVARPGFVGILNYSLFGWIDGTEKEPVQCTMETFEQWPIFTTIQPSASMTKGKLKFTTENYYTLADGQTFIGPRTRVKEFKGIVPLFVASYCETGDEYLDDYGIQGTKSTEILNDYFGELPFQHYSIMLRKAIPAEPGSAPALAMEHLQSSTFFGDTSGMRKSKMSADAVIRSMPTYLHHMSHAFIPLRCYGDTYRPYVMEIPPIVNNIWFNEGFMWFLAYDQLKLESMKTIFSNSVYNTSPIIKKMSLQQLSQTASTLYGSDFRIGRGVYSRGALMAIEMNNYLNEQSQGKKSLKDVLRYLYNWSKENKRAFTMEEFPVLINRACGIDLSEIYKKWQLPVE